MILFDEELPVFNFNCNVVITQYIILISIFFFFKSKYKSCQDTDSSTINEITNTINTDNCRGSSVGILESSESNNLSVDHSPINNSLQICSRKNVKRHKRTTEVRPFSEQRSTTRSGREYGASTSTYIKLNSSDVII
ncbi:hypothetical protein L9F63_025687 [Diploptera punctata]|uniref:Uncharacterized protein n=1 Tax=Diploptera punctata TaxID=6984 RepID=A0AAD7Z7X6_DIPPU|nr:hypothetical protein L9F63_025687 [Diploptera punctata]